MTWIEWKRWFDTVDDAVNDPKLMIIVNDNIRWYDWSTRWIKVWTVWQITAVLNNRDRSKQNGNFEKQEPKHNTQGRPNGVVAATESRSMESRSHVRHTRGILLDHTILFSPLNLIESAFSLFAIRLSCQFFDFFVLIFVFDSLRFSLRYFSFRSLDPGRRL